MFRPALVTTSAPPVMQRGAALLIMLAILTLSISAFLLSGTSRIQHLLNTPYKNMSALSQAKNALIAYSRLSDPDLSAATGLQLRYLPCPDIDGDGIEDTPCGATSTEGWLPWMSLGVSPLRDASGTCLRYFISSAYKQGASVTPSITPALPSGDFNLRNTSTVIATDVVAVIIGPGHALDGQARDLSAGTATVCGSSVSSSAKNLAVNYMDSILGVDNSVAPNFITAPVQVNATANFNDTLLVILAEDL